MGENFPFRTHFFYPPKLEKNGEGKMVWNAFYTNTLSPTPHFIHDRITFAFSHTYYFTFSQHSNVQVLFSPPFFFPPFFYVTWLSWYILLVEWCVAQTHSWLPNCWPRWMVTKSFAHKSLLNSSLLTMFLWAEYTKQFADHVFAGYKSFCPIKFICTLL